MVQPGSTFSSVLFFSVLFFFFPISIDFVLILYNLRNALYFTKFYIYQNVVHICNEKKAVEKVKVGQFPLNLPLLLFLF